MWLTAGIGFISSVLTIFIGFCTPVDLFRNSQHQLQIVNTCYQVKS